MAPLRRARSVVGERGGRGRGGRPDCKLVEENKRLLEKCRSLEQKWRREKRKREELEEKIRKLKGTRASAVQEEEGSGNEENEEVDGEGVDGLQEIKEDNGGDVGNELIFNEDEVNEAISVEEMEEATPSEEEMEEATSSEEEMEEAASSEEEMEEATSSEEEMEEATSSEEEMEEAISSEEEIEEPASSSSSSLSKKSPKRRASLLHLSFRSTISPDCSKEDLINVATSNRRKSTKKPRPLKIHAEDNSKPEGFFCLCSRRFETQGRLTDHIKYYNAEPKFKCDHCPLRFLQLCRLKQHLQSAHKIKYPSATTGCQDCGKVFTKREEHKAHRLLLHPKENEDTYKSHGMDQNAKGNKCTCGRTFTRKQYLLNHVRLFFNNVHWTCKICERTFRAFRFLQAHGRKVHKTEFFPEGTVGCSTCCETFPSRKPLQEHMHKIHGIIPWKEPEGLSMTSPDQLHGFPEGSSRPKRTPGSAGEVLIRCICGSGFSNRRKLTTHIGQNRPHVPFKCPVCAVQFSNHVKLKKHMRNLHDRNYNGYGCTFCGTVYPDRLALRRHALVHKQCN